MSRAPRFLEGLPPSPSPETSRGVSAEAWKFQQTRGGTSEDQARLAALEALGVPSIALKGARARVTAMVAKLERGEVPCFALTRYGRIVAVLAPPGCAEFLATPPIDAVAVEPIPTPAPAPAPAPSHRQPAVLRGRCLE